MPMSPFAKYLPIRQIPFDPKERERPLYVGDQPTILSRAVLGSLEEDLQEEKEKRLIEETKTAISECLLEISEERESLKSLCNNGSPLISDPHIIEPEILSFFNQGALERIFRYEPKGRMLSSDQTKFDVKKLQKQGRSPIHLAIKRERDESGEIVKKPRAIGSRPWDKPLPTDQPVKKKDTRLELFHRLLLKDWIGSTESRFLTYFEPHEGVLFAQIFGFVKNKSGYYFIVSTRDNVGSYSGNHVVSAVYSIKGQRMELKNIFLNSAELTDLEIEGNYFSYFIEGQFPFDYPVMIDSKRLTTYLDREHQSGMLFYFGRPRTYNDGLKQAPLF